MKLSVNILCWNNLKTLKMTLGILRDELVGIKHELVIIDNGSSDGTRDFLKELFQDYLGGGIKAPSLEYNHGISIGKNIGVRISVGEYVLMLDGDVVPVKNSIRMLINYLDNNPDVDVIGFQPNCFALCPNIEGQPKNHEDYCHTLFDVQPAITTCLFYGLYRRRVFDRCMLDESGEYGKIGYGWEDHDFFMQMKSAGMNQRICHINYKGGKYYHAINSSIRNNCMGYDKYMESSQKRAKQFHEKWQTN